MKDGDASPYQSVFHFRWDYVDKGSEFEIVGKLYVPEYGQSFWMILIYSAEVLAVKYCGASAGKEGSCFMTVRSLEGSGEIEQIYSCAGTSSEDFKRD